MIFAAVFYLKLDKVFTTKTFVALDLFTKKLTKLEWRTMHEKLTYFLWRAAFTSKLRRFTNCLCYCVQQLVHYSKLFINIQKLPLFTSGQFNNWVTKLCKMDKNSIRSSVKISIKKIQIWVKNLKWIVKDQK